MPGQVQTEYNLYPDYGYPGQIAQAHGLFHVEEGPIYVPTGGRAPRPGDAVYWNATQNAFTLPIDAAGSARVLGILSYRIDAVQSAESILQYKDDEAVQVCVFGTVYVKAGTSVEYGDRMGWNRDDYDWDKVDALVATDIQADLAEAAVDTGAEVAAVLNSFRDNIVSALNNKIGALAVTCADRYPRTATETILARVGYGRII